MLAVMRAGKVFTPLDPAGPGESSAAALRDAEAVLAIVDESARADASDRFGRGVASVDYRELESGNLDATDADAQSDPGDVALLVYTSVADKASRRGWRSTTAPSCTR